MAATHPLKDSDRQHAADNRNQGMGAGTADRAKDAASNMADKAKDAASGMADRAKDAASHMVDKAKEITSNAGQRVSDAANAAEKRADSAVHSMGSGMENLAGTIREKGPHEGVLGTATSRLASTLESGGHYLQEEGIGGMADDLTNVIKRNPIPALFVGIGLGFLLARATSRR
jgi:hypothetical protein